MAKMKGFGGKADAALVGAATRAAYAGVPRDLSGIFNNIATSYAAGMSQLGAGIGMAAQAVGQAVGTAVNEAKKQNDALLAGGKWFQNQEDNIADQLMSIKQEKKQARKDYAPLSKERRQVMKSLKDKENNIYTRLAQIENTMAESKSAFMEGGLDHYLMGEEANQFFGAFFAGGGEVKDEKGNVVGKTEITFDDNGNEIITFYDGKGQIKKDKYGRNMQGDLDWVKNLPVYKDPKTIENSSKRTAMAYNYGKGGGEWDETAQNQMRNDLEGLYNNRTIGAVLNSKWGGMKHSFLEALSTKDTKQSAEMFNLLTTQYQFTKETGHDVDGDGDVDAKDFATNAEKFISVLTDKQNPLYDSSKTKSAVIDYIIDTEGKNQWQRGRDIYNKKQTQGRTGSDKYFISNQYVPKDKIDFGVKQLLSEEKNIPAQTAWNGINWKKENGNYFYYNSTTGKYEPTTQEQLAANFGYDETVGYIAPKPPTPPKEKKDLIADLRPGYTYNSEGQPVKIQTDF